VLRAKEIEGTYIVVQVKAEVLKKSRIEKEVTL